MNNKVGLQNAWRLLLVQSGITAIVAISVLWIVDATAAKSALLGGLVCILPSTLFAMKLFRFHGARMAKQIVTDFYQGEALKIAVSVALFALIFKYFTVNSLIFFAVYIGLQTVVWFTPLIFAKT